MFYQVAGEHIDQAFRDQPGGGSKEVGTGADTAEGKTEIDQVCGDNIDATAENHRPESVFPDSFIDPFDQLFLSVFQPEI